MKELLSLFRDIDDIKHQERQGWKDIGVESPRDTIASHSYGAAMIAWVLAEERDIDAEKAIKALLVHDLIQAYIPDYTPEDSEFGSKKQLEAERMDQMFDSMPGEIHDEAEELIEEVRGGESEFAVFVKECDKIETLLQSLLYSEELEENHLDEFLDSYEDYFRSEAGQDIFSQIEELGRNLED